VGRRLDRGIDRLAASNGSELESRSERNFDRLSPFQHLMYSRASNSTLALIAALALTACAAQAPNTRDNAALRQTIHTVVPASWREAVETANDISPLAMTPELREFVHAAVKGSTDREQRMRALTQAIIDDDGLGLTYVSDATHTASEVFQSGTANCIGFSNILIASARELGLDDGED
jgi:transglutaminase-like putative cysteine protease